VVTSSDENTSTVNTGATSAPPKIASFDTTAKPITKDGITVDRDAWRVEAKENRTVRLFEVPISGVDDCMLTYRAKLKSENLEGRVYLEMWCRLPSGEFFSKDFDHAVTGTTDWATYQTPFFLKKGERPDLIKLNVVIEGKGTLWIKDVELLKGPLPNESSVDVLGSKVLELLKAKEPPAGEAPDGAKEE
jgi:hypothetical protein